MTSSCLVAMLCSDPSELHTGTATIPWCIDGSEYENTFGTVARVKIVKNESCLCQVLRTVRASRSGIVGRVT